MPLEPPRRLETQRDRDQWARSVVVKPDDGTVTTGKIADHNVTDAKLAQRASASVMGRSEASPGDAHDITSSFNDSFLVRRAGALVWALLIDADIPASIARDTEITAAINALLLLADPFTQYYNQTRGDARYVQLASTLAASATYDPPSLVDGAGTTTTVTCTGAVLGGFASASFSLDLQGITVTAWVSAADTVSVRFQNESGGTLDVASGTLKVRVVN